MAFTVKINDSKILAFFFVVVKGIEVTLHFT